MLSNSALSDESNFIALIELQLTAFRLGQLKLIAAACGQAHTSARTQSIENMMGTARRVCRNVKRWRALRRTAAGMPENGRGFRRLKAHNTCAHSEQR